ncbi:ubiquinone/menaquinone biosynthesis methyltransferase [Haloglycomyces albus]|uniref:ubiquinone/menaquinone biosynthesis methyltransferase n=1 Tax=Haloglycomyces albus TaxID=526067 RepID=UPI001FE0C7A8|nr:ubiquinone/menaquinone biosynthesis methyltransferase [Haloglycomyces albus]
MTEPRQNPEPSPTVSNKAAPRVAAMFDRVAPKYDRTNTITFAGQDKRWRRLTREALSLRPGERCLDLGAGTGVSTAELAASGADVIGVDISIGMMREHGNRDVPLVAADATALPFADDSFDAVTGMFFIRNSNDPHAILREAYRVLKPGGRLVFLETSTPVNKVTKLGHRVFVKHLLPWASKIVSSDPEAYKYLAETTLEWPDQNSFAQWIIAAGYRKVAWRNLAGGSIAMHRGFK